MRCGTKGRPGFPFVLLSLFGALPLAAGCADVTGEAMQQDVAQLRQDLNSLTLAVHRSRSDTDTVVGQLDRRAREQSADTSRQISALSARLDGLTAQLDRTAARIEEISARVESLGRQLSARPAPVPSPGSAPSPPLISAAPAAPTGGPTAEQAYQAAYLDFTRGNFPLAISAFREFVRRFPDSPLADKAQYWVGESYFSLARKSAAAGRTDQATKEWGQAVQEFRRVILNYPRAEKAPTAIYKEALALLELHEPKLAEARLQYLLDHFPQSEEAPLAKQRLETLGG